jgi:hypothetical protein
MADRAGGSCPLIAVEAIMDFTNGPAAYDSERGLYIRKPAEVGDIVLCGGRPATVLDIVTYAPYAHVRQDSPIRGDYWARQWRTTRGSRWAGQADSPKQEG